MSDSPDDKRDALDLSAAENADLCSGCIKCCTYITVEVDAPRTPREYDQWIWALHHENVNLYVEKPERWFVAFDTRCNHLGHDGRCGIYGKHPVLCREYDPRSCERRLPLSDIAAWFHDATEFETWIRLKRPRHFERLEAWRTAPDAAPAAQERPGFVPLDALVMATSRPAKPHATGRKAARRRSGGAANGRRGARTSQKV